MKLNLIATAAFGMEALVKREVKALGYEIISVEDGKVTYRGDERAVVKSNLWLRFADRVLIKTDEFIAKDFETLFQRVKGYPWEELIPMDGAFAVSCSTVKSQLSSEPACQSTVKKAIVDRLCDFFGQNTLAETGARYKVKVTLLKDRVTITVDTTGSSLHKRGYRVKTVPAPIKENMAAALVDLSFWKEDRILVDPFCGSGTIPIEAAMMALNIAPGLTRDFACKAWDIIPGSIWKEEQKFAYDAIDYNKELQIFGSDVSKEAIEAARENSQEAGVDHVVNFSVKPVSKLERLGDSGVIVTNPPYGARIGSNEDIENIYKNLREFMIDNPDWSLFLITSDEELEEKLLNRKADRRRKLYNGRLKTCYYQFHGNKIQSSKCD